LVTIGQYSETGITLARDDEALKRRNAELIEVARRAVAAG